MPNLLVTLKNNPGCAKDILTLVDREKFRPVIVGSLASGENSEAGVLLAWELEG